MRQVLLRRLSVSMEVNIFARVFLDELNEYSFRVFTRICTHSWKKALERPKNHRRYTCEAWGLTWPSEEVLAYRKKGNWSCGV
jgi:hypothetical protein